MPQANVLKKLFLKSIPLFSPYKDMSRSVGGQHKRMLTAEMTTSTWSAKCHDRTGNSSGDWRK